MKMQGLPMPARIEHVVAEEDDGESREFFLIQDIYGETIAYATEERLARLVFAAPGMLTALERLSVGILPLAEMASNWNAEAGGKAIEALKEVRMALNAALNTPVSRQPMALK